MYGFKSNAGQLDQWKVHPETCEFLDQDNIPDVWAAKWYEKQKTAQQIVREQIEKDKEDWGNHHWTRIQVVLFSLLVSSSFLSAYTPGSFYTLVLVTLSAAVRPIFIYFNWMAFVYEATKTDAVIKLVEGIVMK